MTIDLTCQKCESNFEIEAQDLIDGTEKLVCPHCNAKAPASMVDDFVAALAEIRAQVSALSSRFSMSIALETDDLDDDLEADEDEDDESEDELEDDEDVEEDDDELDYEDDDDFEEEDEDDR